MADNLKTIDESDGNSILFAHKAFRLLENNQPEKALALCENGVKRFPFYAEGHFILGKCYQYLKKIDDAKEEYDRTLVYMPGHIRAMKALAYIYHQKNLPVKAFDVLLQSAILDPLNHDLVAYLKAENKYTDIYQPPGFQLQESPAQIEPEMKEAAPPAVTDEQVIEEEGMDLFSFKEEESTAVDEEDSATVWEAPTNEVDAESLLPFDFVDQDLDDSTIKMDDSKVIDFEKDRDTDYALPDIDEDLFAGFPAEAAALESFEDEDRVDWEEEALQVPEQSSRSEKETTTSAARDELIPDEEALDESFLVEQIDDDLFLDIDNAGKPIVMEEDEATQIDEYVDSKDEHTELNIEQYEVNSIIDNIIETDQLEKSKPDLSKFANMEDDFSTLMDGIFEVKEEVEEDEEEEKEISADMVQVDLDDTELVEERPILDTSIIFPDRKKEKQEISRDSEISEEHAEIDLDDDELFSPPAEDTDYKEEEDEISKVIEKIEKAGERPFTARQPGGVRAEPPREVPRMEPLDGVEDENVSIEEILSNPKMLTPTFGEILIAQKKFTDALRVFTELSKNDPGNIRINRKIDFLKKLVEFQK